MLFPQPDDLTIDEPLEPVDEACPACGASTVFRYRVVDYRGWRRVSKCRSCLHVSASEKIQPPVQAGAA
jgi:hypothetical protein